MANLRAVRDDIVVLMLPKQQKAGPLYLPQTAKETAMLGLVLSVGPEVDRNIYPIAIGDIVVFSKYAGTELPWEEGTRVRIMPVDAVLAILQVERKYEPI